MCSCMELAMSYYVNLPHMYQWTCHVLTRKRKCHVWVSKLAIWEFLNLPCERSYTCHLVYERNLPCVHSISVYRTLPCVIMWTCHICVSKLAMYSQVKMPCVIIKTCLVWLSKNAMYVVENLHVKMPCALIRIFKKTESCEKQLLFDGIHVLAAASRITKTPHNVIKCLLLLRSVYWRLSINISRRLHNPCLAHRTWCDTAVHVLKGGGASATPELEVASAWIFLLIPTSSSILQCALCRDDDISSVDPWKKKKKRQSLCQ